MIHSHTHPTNNVGVVTKGRLFLEVDGVETSYGVGEWYEVPADAEHAARFDEDSAEIELWFEVRPPTPERPRVVPGGAPAERWNAWRGAFGSVSTADGR